MKRAVFTIALSFLLTFNARADQQAGSYKLPVAADEIKVMQYNVQNLFDAAHDEGKNDYTFLPKNSKGKSEGCAQEDNTHYRAECFATDWTEANVQLKLSQLKRAVAEQGSLPDILTVEEIENVNIAQMLADELGFDEFVITEGEDARGIDVAAFYRTDKLKLLEADEVSVDEETKFATRPVLRLRFAVSSSGNGSQATSDLFLYVNHWPSQSNPTTSRVAVAKAVRELVEADQSSMGKKSFYAMVVGDLNTTGKEKPNPVRDVLSNGKGALGLLDLHELSDASKNPMLGTMPTGSYFYGNAWDRLDKMLISRDLAEQSAMPETFRVLGPDMLMSQNSKGVARPFTYVYNAKTAEQAGFSDHLALVAKFKIR